MQLELGLPKIDKTATRQAIRVYFAVYRKFKLLLAMEFETHSEEPHALKGFEKAMDPGLIRAPYSMGGGGLNSYLSSNSMETPQDAYRQRFVDDVEYKVKKLRPYQRGIIEELYMRREGDERTMDADVFESLRASNPKWNYSERYYDEQKAIAIFTLAEAFRIIQYKNG